MGRGIPNRILAKAVFLVRNRPSSQMTRWCDRYGMTFRVLANEPGGLLRKPEGWFFWE